MIRKTLLISLVVAAIGCGGAHLTKNAPIRPPAGWTKHEMGATGLSLYLPADAQEQQMPADAVAQMTGTEGIEVEHTYLATLGKPQPTNVVVFLSAKIKGSGSLDEFVNGMEKGIQRTDSSAKFTRTKEQTPMGEAIKLKGPLLAGGTKTSSYFYTWQNGQEVVMLMVMGLAGEDPTLPKNVADTMQLR